MGYDIHITRSEWWAADERPGHITSDEWRCVAEADSEFVEDGADDFLWTVSAWAFCYRGGQVNVKSPNDETLRKIFEVARKLNALVQGDEGEYYRQTDGGYETSLHEDFSEISYQRDSVDPNLQCSHREPQSLINSTVGP